MKVHITFHTPHHPNFRTINTYAELPYILDQYNVNTIDTIVIDEEVFYVFEKVSYFEFITHLDTKNRPVRFIECDKRSKVFQTAEGDYIFFDEHSDGCYVLLHFQWMPCSFLHKR